MKSWFEPFTYEELNRDPRFLWLTKSEWFPRNAVVMMTSNGSMEMRIIRHLIEHINTFVRSIVLPSAAYCLTLDGHASRNGYAWLEYSKRVGCEVVQLPSDTSHFLQPCDRKVNKELKRAVKDYRDMLCGLGTINLNSVRTKLVLAIVGLASISPSHIVESFKQCGLWPMDYRFTNLSIEHSCPSSIITRTPRFVSDFDTVHYLKQIVLSNENCSVILAKAGAVLAQHLKSREVLAKPCDRENTHQNRNEQESAREILYRGTPAKCLTIGNIIETRKKRAKEKKDLELLKVEEKAKKEAEREKKRALRAIKGTYRGEKKQKIEAVEGLLALTK